MSLDMQMATTRDYANRLPDYKRRVLVALLNRIEDARGRETSRDDERFTNGLLEALEIVMRELQ